MSHLGVLLLLSMYCFSKARFLNHFCMNSTILVVFDLPVSSQHKRSHALSTNPKYQDNHQLRRLPTQSDITGRHHRPTLWTATFGPGSWRHHVAHGSLSLTHLHCGITQASSVILPLVNLMWRFCTSSPTHTWHHGASLLKTKPDTSALAACAQEQLPSQSQRHRHKPPPHKPYYRVNWITLGFTQWASELEGESILTPNSDMTCTASQISQLLCQQYNEMTSIELSVASTLTVTLSLFKGYVHPEFKKSVIPLIFSPPCWWSGELL